jgi:hypothetical protein
MSQFSNNDVYFRGYLDVNSNDPQSAAFARMWNQSLKEEKNRNNNNNYYGGSMQTTTCNWGTISNGSHAFSASFYG